MESESRPPLHKAQILIDEEISQLQESIRLLHCRRNQYALTANLPPEILSRIFAYVEWTQQRQTPQSEHPYNFSFVSRDWRQIAISTPELWATLPEHHPVWGQIVLERSKASDLTVRVSGLHDHRSDILRHIFADHAARLLELSITSLDSDTMSTQSLLNTLPTSAPRLRTLHLAFSKSPRAILTLPLESFSDTRLTSLVLHRCSIAWKSSLLTGLTDLKITDNRSLSSGPLVNLFDALRRMPALKKLVLINSIPYGSPPPSTDPVSLFCLEELRISAVMFDLEKILAYLSVPASTVVRLNCTSWSRNADDSRPFDQRLSAFTKSIRHFFSSMRSDTGGGPPSYDTLSISPYSDSGETMSIQAWRNNWIPLYPPFTVIGDENPDFTLLAPWHDVSAPYLAQALPLSHLRTLILMLKPDFSSLLRTFGYLQMLETIIFNGSSEVTKALRCKASTIKPDRDRLTFPALENLHMRDVLFEKYKGVDHITIDSLRNLLMVRSEYGAPVQKLSIFHSCEIGGSDIGLLKEIVVDVEWDEFEEEYAPPDPGSNYSSD